MTASQKKFVDIRLDITYFNLNNLLAIINSKSVGMTNKLATQNELWKLFEIFDGQKWYIFDQPIQIQLRQPRTHQNNQSLLFILLIIFIQCMFTYPCTN